MSLSALLSLTILLSACERRLNPEFADSSGSLQVAFGAYKIAIFFIAAGSPLP